MATRAINPSALHVNRAYVLATYRDLLRATRIAFWGDRKLLLAARTQARDSFDKDRQLALGGEEAVKSIEHAQGVTQILKENVVQGQKKGEETYKLNIHEHTQRMDNEMATKLKGTTKTFKEIKNAQF